MASQGEIPLPEITAETFERAWTRFTLAATAKEWDNNKQLAIIPTLLRGKLLDYYVDLEAAEKGDLDTLKENLMIKAGLKKNPLIAARDFLARNQSPNEKVGDFVLDLKKKFKQAYPAEPLTSAVLLQKFLTGLQPSISRHVLLNKQPETLDDAIKRAIEVEHTLEAFYHHIGSADTPTAPSHTCRAEGNSPDRSG